MPPEQIDPELPWGYWLRVQSVRGAPVFVDDQTGEQWRTLRSAFWKGRLGMQADDKEPPPEHLELVHAVLATRARRAYVQEPEEVADLFSGSRLFRGIIYDWMFAAGLLGRSGDPGIETLVTPEGWSALAMLHATRPYSMRQRRPSGMTVRDLLEVGLGPEEREERLARVERTAMTWDVCFMRQMDAGRPSVILTRRGDGPVPLKQTVWALAFETELARDNFFEWICFRMDRWDAWSEIAGNSSAKELTHKLLSVMASSLQPHRPEAPPMMQADYR
ncbi:hypothetical protein ACFSC3_08000 [Sphingomonas floccifaciens]|uniref:Uncharacterized protein n=1 Tax=Sphingomonas floccifaciens TaxID=1844115 RepID=A0ABW4NBV1_9SPHN